MLVHVLYENPDWLPPLEAALRAEGLDYRLVEVWQGALRLDQAPPEGVWINRMSPSSHTRGHLESVALMRETLAWLDAYDRPVINGARAFRLEISKVQQDLALRRHGIQTPRTVAAVGRDALLELAATFDGPFITKHNQGGKGLGIELFNGARHLQTHLDSGEFDTGPDGVVILQQYIAPAGGYITRVELVAGEFMYAMRSSTAQGFELCPSDACQIDLANVCPADGNAKFSLDPMTADDPIVAQYRAMCAAEGLSLAGIEFVEDAHGQRYTYDINGTTNYNSAVAEEAGVDGMRALARHVASLG
jgi:hypothetical protein